MSKIIAVANQKGGVAQTNYRVLTDKELKEYSQEYLPEIAMITLINIETLQSVSGHYQWEIVKNFYSDNYDLAKIHSILGKGIRENIIEKFLSFAEMDRAVFNSLSAETQEQLIGCYDMLIDTVPDEELKKELKEILTNMEGDSENG